ncbi:MAG TPA: hypothetical protein VGM17_16520 [Rhizomicrobium sp.]
MEHAIHLLIGWFSLPVWIGTGFADYIAHRITHIERTSGVGESLIHHVMMAEVGLPIIASAFFRIDAAMVVLFIVCFAAHEITGNLDIRYAESHGRHVGPTEDQLHSFLEIIPLTAALLILLPHFGQVLALFGLGPEHADFSVALKQPPAMWKIVFTAAMLVIFIIGPYTEETIRTWRYQRRSVALKPAE